MIEASVDLESNTSGIVAWGDSRRPRYWARYVTRNGDGTYSVRIENGWYENYHRDGRPANGDPDDPHIVEFIPCHGNDPRARDLPSEITP